MHEGTKLMTKEIVLEIEIEQLEGKIAPQSDFGFLD